MKLTASELRLSFELTEESTDDVVCFWRFALVRVPWGRVLGYKGPKSARYAVIWPWRWTCTPGWSGTITNVRVPEKYQDGGEP